MVFESFVEDLLETGRRKVDQAVAFIWYAESVEHTPVNGIDDVVKFFDRARLPLPNKSRLNKELAGHRWTRKSAGGWLTLNAAGLAALNEKYAAAAPKISPPDLVQDINLALCPYIDASDVRDARSMAELYIVTFCLENSMRRHIEKVLSGAMGADWWVNAASSSMLKKEENRRENEKRHKWAPTRRTTGPLYSLDWPDLISLMRKHETLFVATLGAIDFLHRYSDLGALRNVIAHHGVVDDSVHFKRVEIAYHDWVKQVTQISS